jgi:acyl-CoA synthetase (AMP-forming)/AMP-acid ligase II
LPTLKRVLSAGAPVPLHVLYRMKAAISSDGDVHTPYGATEALPVASVAASEVWDQVMHAMSPAPEAGGQECLPFKWGTCVGRHFPGIEWKMIRITDEPIADMRDAEELPAGEIGELIVRGPVVTTEYVTHTEANALHKVRDGDTFWHRMGDVGYLDGDRFWFCGRKSHRVITPRGTLFTIPCEAVFNRHPWIYRSALVGVGSHGEQQPVVFVEAWPEHRRMAQQNVDRLISELRDMAVKHSHTSEIEHFFFMWGTLPVDIRHNAKIFREELVKPATQLLELQHVIRKKTQRAKS